MTEERGDASAVRFASILHDEAETVARRHGGRLVKLLGDGAMLFFHDPSRAVPATMELVRSLAEVGLPAHAGVHAGPVIERDRDFFGRTVNVAARIAGKGGPTEVLVTDSVLSTQTDPRISFKPLGKATLKGVPEPVPLFRAEPRENT
jgi:class 3 adenylate cyclase